MKSVFKIIVLILVFLSFYACKKEVRPEISIVQNIEIEITKVNLDLTINTNGFQFPPPRLYLELKVINNTLKDMEFRFAGKYSDIKDSRLFFMNLTNGKVLFSGGYGTEQIKKEETLLFDIEVYLRDKKENYFDIPAIFFDGKDFDYSEDTSYLFKQIKEAFDQSIVILYLNSEDLNHLNPTNQANEYLQEDHVIQVKWAKDLKYEIYKEKVPLPVVNNINL